MDVFVSVGVAATTAHEEFINAVEARLRSEGLEPKTVGRNTFSSDAPLKAVMELMDRCQGTVVIALERSFYSQGVETRAGKERLLADVRLPTVWNQTEAAMAYSRGHPLLVLAQEGLRSEGLLEARYDWNVQWIMPTPAALATPEFNGILASWKTKVQAYRHPAAAAGKVPDKWTLSELLKLFTGLPAGQAWSAIVAASAIVAGAFALGAKIGPKFLS
jgi:hypothetical protein